MRPDWYDKGKRHIWLPYTQMKTVMPPLPVERSEGVRLHLSDGSVLIDGIASWWTAVHGYNHPDIVDAAKGQLDQLPHVMLGGLVHGPVMTLAQRLAALLPEPLERVFFSDSGSVAVEVAMKMAVQYWLNRGYTEKTRFVSFEGNYHGDTFATMSICDPEEGMHHLFAGVSPEQILAPLPTNEEAQHCFEQTLDRRKGQIAAVVVEPLVQGAIGMRMHAPEVLQSIMAAAKARGLLVISDEIFTGFGRTGTMFAFEQTNCVPDIITVSKALTGGVLPLAATIASDEIFSAFWSDDPEAALMHGPTFMGNATACAAALASLDLFQTEPRLRQIAEIESHFANALTPLAELRNVVDVRVKGAIGAVELTENADPNGLKRAFIDRGVWIRPIGNVIYSTPPYVIERTDLETVTNAICDVVQERSKD